MFAFNRCSIVVVADCCFALGTKLTATLKVTGNRCVLRLPLSNPLFPYFFASHVCVAPYVMHYKTPYNSITKKFTNTPKLIGSGRKIFFASRAWREHRWTSLKRNDKHQSCSRVQMNGKLQRSRIFPRTRYKRCIKGNIVVNKLPRKKIILKQGNLFVA